jgi:hypothetical protein
MGLLMSLLIRFLAPYGDICLLSAWGVAQNLEGLGIFKYLNDPVEKIGGNSVMALNLDPAVGVSVVSVIMTLALIAVFYLNVRASFAVAKKVGFISIAVWISPGLLSIVGYSIDESWLAPDVFRSGSGFPGGARSAAVNLGMVLVLGWSVAILIGSRWNKNKLKNVYDHFWYPLGLVAVLYFVIDSGLSFYKADADNEIKQQIGILNLYKISANNIDRACSGNEYISTRAGRLCEFQRGLLDQVSMQLHKKPEIRGKMEIPDWIKILSDGKDAKLLMDIDMVNAWACDRGNRSEMCFQIPLDEVLDPKNPDKSYIFLPPVYAKFFQASSASLRKVEGRINDIEIGRNIRYFAFLAVGLLAGGKVANATRALLTKDVAKQKSWLILFLKALYSFLVWAFAGSWSRLKSSYVKYRHMLQNFRVKD